MLVRATNTCLIGSWPLDSRESAVICVAAFLSGGRGGGGGGGKELRFEFLYSFATRKEGPAAERLCAWAFVGGLDGRVLSDAETWVQIHGSIKT